ncbi:hypothetical protein D3C85_1103750 [compost metagenome]
MYIANYFFFIFTYLCINFNLIKHTVSIGNFTWITYFEYFTVTDKHGSVTVLPYRLHIMRHKNDRLTFSLILFEYIEAFPLKRLVANS